MKLQARGLMSRLTSSAKYRVQRVAKARMVEKCCAPQAQRKPGLGVLGVFGTTNEASLGLRRGIGQEKGSGSQVTAKSIWKGVARQRGGGRVKRPN